ncbi:MAG: methyl-accepting chemotaxis protein [Candidatus Tectimicrobiota bacterium]
MNALLNRMLIWQKLLIVALLGLLAVLLPLGLYLREAHRDYDFTRREAQGIGPALSVIKVLHSSQQHRGLAAQTLAGREDADTRRATMQQTLEQHITQMETEWASALSHAKIGKAWRLAVKEWKSLVSKVHDKALTVEASFQAHTALSALWLDVLEQVRDAYHISLDPEASSYFLHLAALVAAPHLTEVLGQTRAKGAGLLAQQQATEVDKVTLLTLLAQAREHQTTTTRSVEKAYTVDPTLQPRIAPVLHTLNTKMNQAVKLAEDTIIKAPTLTFAPLEYFSQYTATINAAFDVIEALTGEFQAALQTRLATQRYTAGLLLGAVLLLTLVAASLAYVVARGIAVSARQLSEAVSQFAQGDDQARVRLDTQDELGQLSAAFNTMIDERVGALQRENDQLNVSVIELLQAVAKIAQKDLTQRVPVAEDVTGPVADALNLLTDETAEVLVEVTRIAENVAMASRRVQAQSDAVITLADDERLQVADTAEQLAAAAEAMNDIAALAQTCNMSAETAITRTQTALETVTNTVEGINTIRDTIRETEKRIKRLGERSQEIGGAVNLINSIAERTHILALNASMHAASAGEAGRGFAVVAEEVQRLAENARQSTEQIAQLVNNIQTETMDTVSTMNTVISQVVDGSRLAGQAGEQMRQTQQSTAELVASVRQIAAGAQTQARVSNTLRDRASTIVESTRKTSEQLAAQGSQTSSLLDYASRLVRAVRVFKLPMSREDGESAQLDADLSPTRNADADARGTREALIQV